MYLAALQCAKRELLIANPYFIPDARVIEMLAGAGRRGVAVKLMLAGEHMDLWWARQNGVRLYGQLLEAGVRSTSSVPLCCTRRPCWWMACGPPSGPPILTIAPSRMNEEINLCFHDRAIAEELVPFCG